MGRKTKNLIVNEFSKFVKKARTDREMTFKAFGDLTGCEPIYLGWIEHGRIEFPLAVLVALFKHLSKAEREELQSLVCNYMIERLKTGTTKRD